MVTRIHDVTLEHGIRLGGPQAWKDRPGFTFVQAPGETALIQLGAKVNLARTPAPDGSAKPGVAPTEGADPHLSRTTEDIPIRKPHLRGGCNAPQLVLKADSGIGGILAPGNHRLQPCY